MGTTRYMTEEEYAEIRRAYAASHMNTMGGVDYHKIMPEWFEAQTDRMDAEDAGDEAKRLDAIWRATKLIAWGS